MQLFFWDWWKTCEENTFDEVCVRDGRGSDLVRDG